MPPESSALILQDCYANQIASMLRQCPEVGRERLLQGLSGRVAGRSRRLLKYSGDTVGAWMIVDILVLPADIDVSGALERVAGDTYICDANNLPVVGQERKLIGSVALAELLRATPNTSVGTLTRSLDVSGLSANLSLSGAERHPGWHYSDSLLVVNQQEEVEGALRFSTLRRALGILQEPDPGTTSIMSDYLQTYQLTLSSLFNLVSGGLHKPVDFKFDERGETT
jgi:hypothetical protein